MKTTLLLNATYEPLTVISWKKALTLIFLGKAEMLSPQNASIRTISQSFALPSVLRLLRRVRIPRRSIKFSRTNVYRRDGFRCQYCNERFAPPDLTFDHVIPRSRNGETNWTNIVTSCQPCNRKKCNRTPEESGMALIKEPVEPRWWPFADGCENIEHHPEDWKPYLWIT